jgi:hypothetical protein
MGLVLDIAAGILLAVGIVGLVPYGNQITTIMAKRGDPTAVGLFVSALGVVLGIALVVCRLLRWP